MDTARVRPTQLVVGGTALARDESGRVVFVDGALPGETVLVRMRQTKKDFAKADVVEILEASPDRVDPPCQAWHRGCGGCDWQHIHPSAQLELKAEIVHEALTRMGRIGQPRMYLGAAVPPWGYRTTVRLAADAEGRVGFRSRRSHDVVAITECMVAHPQINQAIAGLTVNGGREITVRVGVGSGERTATSRFDSDFVGLPGDIAVGPEAIVHETVAGVNLQVSAGSFFQTSPQSAELLVDAVDRAFSDIDLTGATMVDAYGGVGLFSCTVGRQAAKVVLVESSASSCADATVNLASRGESAVVVKAKIEEWQPVAADLVVADPARNGLDKIGAQVVARTGAQRIVLISCDPASLARDTVLLRTLGYLHQWSEVLDLFPNTSHIEVVTVFDRIG